MWGRRLLHCTCRFEWIVELIGANAMLVVEWVHVCVLEQELREFSNGNASVGKFVKSSVKMLRSTHFTFADSLEAPPSPSPSVPQQGGEVLAGRLAAVFLSWEGEGEGGVLCGCVGLKLFPPPPLPVAPRRGGWGGCVRSCVCCVCGAAAGGGARAGPWSSR